jgi:hypothetical protein
MAGFADGFRSGFGLISDVKDRELKRDQIEADQEYKRQQASDLRGYREEDLKIKRSGQESDSLLANLRANTARIQAENAGLSSEAALLNAQTSNIKARNATNPESIDYKKGLSEIDENKAQERNYQSQADERLQKVSRVKGAENVQEIYNYSIASQTNGLGPDDYERISKLIDENGSQSSFNLGYLTSPQTARSMSAVQTFMGDIASGSNAEMTPELRAAFGGALGLNKSAAIGRQIDESFINAPDWMKSKGLRIKSQGLHEVGSVDGNKLSGSLYVLAEDKEGNAYPYFPPLTSKRNFADNQPLELEFGEMAQAMAGTAHMIQQIGPKISRDVRAAKIQTMYGGNKDFDAAVNAKLETVRKGIQNGASPTDAGKWSQSGMANAPVSEQVAFTKTDEYRREIEHEMLFGPTDDTSEQFKIQEWFESTSSALASAPLPKGIKAANLGELMSRSNASFNYQNASILQGYYNEDGEIEDAAGLVDQLEKLNLLK